MERLCELACDEAAVRGLNTEQRKAYGRVLLAAAAGPLPAGASGMSAGPENLKARLFALFEQRKANRRQMLAAAAGVAGCRLPDRLRSGRSVGGGICRAGKPGRKRAGATELFAAAIPAGHTGGGARTHAGAGGKARPG